MAVSSYFKSALLDFAAEQAVNLHRSIYDAMQAMQSARMVEVEKGRFVISFSDGATSSAQTLITGGQALTPLQIVEAWAELRYLYRRIRNQFLAEGVADPTETAVIAELYSVLDNPPTEAYGDFSEVKLPNSYQKIT